MEQAIAPHNGSHYLGVDGEIIKIFDPMPPPFPLGWIPNVTFVQPELEQALLIKQDPSALIWHGVASEHQVEAQTVMPRDLTLVRRMRGDGFLKFRNENFKIFRSTA